MSQLPEALSQELDSEPVMETVAPHVLDKQQELVPIPDTVQYAELINDPNYTVVVDLAAGDTAVFEDETMKVDEGGPVSVTLVPRQVKGNDKSIIDDALRVKFLQEVVEIPPVREYLRTLAIFIKANTKNFGHGRFNGNDFRGTIDYLLDDSDECNVAIRLLNAAMLRDNGDVKEQLIFVGQIRSRE